MIILKIIKKLIDKNILNIMSEKNSNSNKNNYEELNLIEDNENEEINPEELADQAGESVFHNIYKNVKSKIKDKIITKLLYKIERQEIKIHDLETENKKLKDDFTYILKRILLTKTEFKNNSNIIKENLYNKYYKLNTSTNTNSTNNISSHKKTHTNITIDNNIYDISDITSEEVTPTKQNSSEFKIKKYLNNLIRKNFVNNTDGTTTTHYIGKKINLYDELFPKNNLSNINSNNFNNVSNININNNITNTNIRNETNSNTKEKSLHKDKSKQSKKNLCLDLKTFKKAIIANYSFTDSASKDKKKKKIKIYQGGMSDRKVKNNYSFFKKHNEYNKNCNNKYIKVHYKKPNAMNVLDSSDPNKKYKYNYYNCYYAVGCGIPRTPYLASKSSKKYI